MTTPKFDLHDRKRVISAIENYLQVKLHKAGSREKLLKDETGKSYWVLGGTGDWHGIPKEMFAEEEKLSSEGVLVIAKRKLNSIDIFVGSLPILIRNKSSLCRTDKDYQFNVKTFSEGISLKEAPDVRLKKISTIDYTKDDKVSDKTVHKVTHEVNKLVKDMTAVEKKQFWQKLFPNDIAES